MKKHITKFAASVSAICIAASMCTSLTASAVSFTPNAVTPKHGTFWNQYWQSNYGNIVLDYCRSNQDNQDYLYTPGRNIRAVSTSSGPNRTVIVNYNDVLRMYGSNYNISQAGQCGLYNVEKAYDFLQANGYTYSNPLYVAINDVATYSPGGGDGERENAWAADDTLFFGMGSRNLNKAGAVTFLGSATDIVTHELMHLVTAEEIGWTDYGSASYEAQALMEAYSDILAELADEQHDWKVGATLFVNNSSTNNYCYRNIANPAATNNPLSEETYFDNYEDFQDFIQENPYYGNYAAVGSTVISHAAYLMHEMGYSDQTLAKIWLRSITKMNTGNNATFSDCREAFYEAAIEVLSQIGGRYYIAQVFQLMTAFDEVGVAEQ